MYIGIDFVVVINILFLYNVFVRFYVIKSLWDRLRLLSDYHNNQVDCMMDVGGRELLGTTSS